MPRTTSVVTIFYSATNDTQSADLHSEFQKVCQQVEQARNVSIKILFWKDNIPGGIAGASGQDRIDDFVAGDFDIYFGCLGIKFGLGTVREFRKAMKSHIDDGAPSEILFGFNETPINPFDIPDTFTEVRKFRNDVQTAKRYGKSILYFTFRDEDDYRAALFRDLNEAVKTVLTNIKGGMLPPP